MERRSFLKNAAPVLTGAVHEETADASIRAILNFSLHGAEGIDLHLAHLDAQSATVEALGRIVSASPLPIFGLNYAVSQSEEEEEQRVALLMRCFEAGAAGIDLQGYSFDHRSRDRMDESAADTRLPFVKRRPKEVVFDRAVIDRQCDLIERIHAAGGEVLLSNHIGTFMNAEEMISLCLYLRERKADTIKIVTVCDTDEELAELVRSMLLLKKEIEVPVTLIATGRHRTLSRILNALLGGYMVFTADTYTKYANIGQPDITAIKQIVDNADRLMRTIDGHGLRGGL